MESFSTIVAKQETASNNELHERFVFGLEYYLEISSEEAEHLINTWKVCGYLLVNDVEYTDETKEIYKGHQYIMSNVTKYEIYNSVRYNKFPLESEPKFDCRCICGQLLTRKNVWITDGYSVISIGSCCGEKFIACFNNKCDGCNIDIRHNKNRKDNLCIECRKVSIETEKKKALQKIEEEKIQLEKDRIEFIRKQEEIRQEQIKLEREKYLEARKKCKCGKMKDIKYDTCWKCIPKCKCGKNRKENYEHCFECYKKNKPSNKLSYYFK